MALTGLKQSPWSTLDNHWNLPPHLAATEQGWLATLSRTKTQSPTAKAGSKYQLNSPSLLVYLQAASSTSEVQTYAGQLSNLLEASLDHTYLPQSAMNRRVPLANEITSAIRDNLS